MGAKSHGPRHRSRYKLKKRARDKGMPSVGKFLKTFEPGQTVVVKPESSVQKGMPAIRHYGLMGIIVKRRGRAYVVKVMEGNKEKSLIAYPVHLKAIKE